MKKKKFGLFAVLTAMMAIAITIVVSTKKQEVAKADWYFDRIPIKKCAFTLSETDFEWTGKPNKPQVTVNYEGKELVQGSDYVVEYRNNVDAGTGKVVVQGKGEYRGKYYLSFNIIGINFQKECDVIIDKGKVRVFYQGELLDTKSYEYTSSKQERLIDSVELKKGNLNTYEITTRYAISGKGRFSDTIIKTEKTTDVRFE